MNDDWDRLQYATSDIKNKQRHISLNNDPPPQTVSTGWNERITQNCGRLGAMDKIFRYKNSKNTHRTSVYHAPYNSRHRFIYNLYYAVFVYYIIYLT